MEREHPVRFFSSASRLKRDLEAAVRANGRRKALFFVVEHLFDVPARVRLVAEKADSPAGIVLHGIHRQQHRLRTGKAAHIYFNKVFHCIFSFSGLSSRFFSAQIGSCDDEQYDDADDDGDLACRRRAAGNRRLGFGRSLCRRAGQTEVMRSRRAEQHAKEGHGAVGRALTGQNKLAQRTAAGQNSRKADNVHAENIPEVLRMRDRLTGEAEVKITGSEIVDRHDRKQRRNDAEQVKVFHEDDVADASCEAHAALLCERADDERRDQRKDNGRVLAAGTLGAHGVNAGRRADDEQSGEQDRQDCAAQRLRLIGATEREALLEEERASRNAARKADERDPCVQITCGHAQHHAERTAEEYERADHHRGAEDKAHHRRKNRRWTCIPSSAGRAGTSRRQSRRSPAGNTVRARPCAA